MKIGAGYDPTTPSAFWYLSPYKSLRRGLDLDGSRTVLPARRSECARCPAGTAALDAVPEAYHNPAAVWWGAFAPSPVMWPWTAFRANSRRPSGCAWRCRSRSRSPLALRTVGPERRLLAGARPGESRHRYHRHRRDHAYIDPPAGLPRRRKQVWPGAAARTPPRRSCGRAPRREPAPRPPRPRSRRSTPGGCRPSVTVEQQRGDNRGQEQQPGHCHGDLARTGARHVPRRRPG